MADPSRDVVRCFRNALLVKDGAFVKDDLWVRNGKVIDPRDRFFDERKPVSAGRAARKAGRVESEGESCGGGGRERESEGEDSGEKKGRVEAQTKVNQHSPLCSLLLFPL